MATKRTSERNCSDQNGVGPQKGDDLRDKILAKDQANVARMRKLTICSWILVGASLAAAGVVRLSYPDIMRIHGRNWSRRSSSFGRRCS